MRYLVLEDSENRINWFKPMLIGTVTDYTAVAAEAIELLKHHEYDYIFLDHDLAEEHYMQPLSGVSRNIDGETGYAVAKYLSEHPEASRKAAIIIHSLNPMGAERMSKVLADGGRESRHIPFPILQKSLVIAGVARN